MNILENQKEKIKSEVDNFIDNLSDTQDKIFNTIDEYMSFYEGTKRKFEVILIDTDKSDPSYVSHSDLFDLISKSSDYKTIFDLMKFCCEKIDSLEVFLSNKQYLNIKDCVLNKKRKYSDSKYYDTRSCAVLNKKSNNLFSLNDDRLNSDSEEVVPMPSSTNKKSKTINKNKNKARARKILNFENKCLTKNNEGPDEPLLKQLYYYYLKNKPHASILVTNRKRIFINYYLESGKRTTKSYSIANIKSLDEFKDLLEEIRYFIKNHRVSKN
jgi:hypothetical protein